MVFKSPHPKDIEELGLIFEDGLIKDSEGKIVPLTDERLKNVRTKINWSWLGPIIAIIIFVLGWAGVVSERAYTATVNSESITRQQAKIGKQEVQIEELKKANERQEIMMKQQTQIIDKQDKVMSAREKYADKRLDAIERGVIDEIRALRIEIKDLKSEIHVLQQRTFQND